MRNETRLERLLRIMRRWRRHDEARDRGTWRGLPSIATATGFDRDMLRGLLVEQVAAGAIEVIECANGVYWRAAIEKGE